MLNRAMNATATSRKIRIPQAALLRWFRLVAVLAFSLTIPPISGASKPIPAFTSARQMPSRVAGNSLKVIGVVLEVPS
jgi:hypothetical protein